jgi:hypothetical protein
VYRPLSVPAAAGFALAALYAGFLVVEAVVAWPSGTPLLMPAAWLLWPAAALVVSALGWVRVQRSEGTRAGGRLASWGMLLSVLFGLGYGAYHAAAYHALQQQAEGLADRWINLLRDGRLDEAFLLTLPPKQRPEAAGAALHRQLERRFNVNQLGDPQAVLATFGKSPLVRLFGPGDAGEAGTGIETQPLGVRAWEYRDGAYHVQVGYKVTTPEREAEVQVVLSGSEGEARQEGRQWVVVANDSKILRQVRIFPLGQRLSALRASSRQFIEAWTTKLGTGRFEEAYLEAQDPSRREELRREYVARLALAVPATALDPCAAGPLLDDEWGRLVYLPGYRDFRDGSPVRVAPDAYWTDARLAQEIPAEVKTLLERPGQSGARGIQFEDVATVAWRRDGNQFRLRHGFHMVVGNQKHAVTGDVIVATDARVLEEDAPRPVWQLVGLELHHGGTLKALPPGM